MCETADCNFQFTKEARARERWIELIFGPAEETAVVEPRSKKVGVVKEGNEGRRNRVLCL